MKTLLLLLAVLGLILFSALCSGINVGLVSLDRADLRRKAKLNNPAAKKVLPFRKNLHLTLAAILLSNVASISGTSLILNNRFNGVIAEIASTLLIVVLGEVLPQALFARYALQLCAAFTPLLQLMIVITYPIAKPLQLLLDRLFGQEISHLQSRRELGILIGEHAKAEESELDGDEIEIMRGALQLSEKRVKDIMTDLRKVYWLTPGTKLTPAKIDEIKERGWSRIPILNRQAATCYGLLLMKDLVDVDFDGLQLTVEDLVLYPTQVVGSKTALDTLFRKFISGGTHLFPVERDDQIIGIVTIEDLLEEIVGREIEDETDRSRRKSTLAKQKH